MFAWVRLLVLVAVLVAAEFVVQPLLGWRVRLDLLVVALLLFAIRVRPGAAALAGLVLGALADAASPSGLGSGMLALATVGYVTSWLKAAFFAENAVLNWIVIFASAWGATLLRLLLGGGVFEPGFAIEALVWAPLSAAATAFVGVLLFMAVRPALREISS
ncbi:MAG: rod shape-determining protein MreD [Gemmatimonadaceae bacterium]|nr:rod shape-determining protein MreD [Gemmatimonadaceae bacterium]